MNTKLDVTRRPIAPIVVALAENVDVAFEKVLLHFLKKSAETGLDLEQVTITVFDEVFAPADNDELFDGTLGSFLSLLMDEVHLRRRLGNAMLDVIMPATVMGYDIYQLIEELEASHSESVSVDAPPTIRKVLPVLRPERNTAPHGPVSGVGGRHKTFVMKHEARS